MTAPEGRSAEGRGGPGRPRHKGRPDVITNQGGNTLLAALRAAIPDAPAMAGPGAAEAPTTLAEVSIATAFVSPAGFGAIAERLEQAARVRLLLGAEPAPEAARVPRRPGDPPGAAFRRREVAEGLRLLDQGLRRERDRQPFSAESRRHLRAMARMLRAGKLETRRYERAFLHAKATLLDGLDPGVVVGSSNLTRAGLTTNLELNLGRWDAGVFAQARAWFDALWEEAAPFDLAAIFEAPEREFPPWLILLRVLWQLYGEELEQEREEAGDIPLTAFQLHGVWRARRILRDFGGVIVADEVGLGKTFIAGEILSATAKKRQRALLICPAALSDTTWRRFFDAHGISRLVEMVSYDELSRDRQFHDARRRPLAVQAVLSQPIEDYALVVVDEAHNYRNPDAPYRAEGLRRLLAGERKGLVLLTATPVTGWWAVGRSPTPRPTASSTAAARATASSPMRPLRKPPPTAIPSVPRQSPRRRKRRTTAASSWANSSTAPNTTPAASTSPRASSRPSRLFPSPALGVPPSGSPPVAARRRARQSSRMAQKARRLARSPTKPSLSRSSAS